MADDTTTTSGNGAGIPPNPPPESGAGNPPNPGRVPGTSVDRPTPPPLPATVSDLLAQRKSERLRTLNDDVDDIHLRLWLNTQYRGYLEPIWREDTVEGSFVADDIKAADMIRDYAIANDVPLARRAKLHSIMRSLHVVCRRYGISRKERQHMVGDQKVGFVDPDNDGYNGGN